MSKKKAAPKPEEGKAKGVRGKKACPVCHTLWGVRLAKCEKCGYEFRSKSEMLYSPQHLQGAMQFVALTGGFPAARQALSEAETFLKQVDAWKEKIGKMAS